MYKLSDIRDINRGHFKSDFSYFVIESIIQGNTSAEAYVDQKSDPHITVVWDDEYSVYCGGSAHEDILMDAVEFINKSILTLEVRRDRGIIKIMYENDSWKEALTEGMKEQEPAVYSRSVYRHGLMDIPDFSCSHKDISIKRMDREMLYDSGLENVQGVVEEVTQMWGSVEEFLSGGFGFCALKGSSIAAWCTCEYLSDAWCGIGIETYEPYQGQGVATAVTIETLKHCRDINKIPHWDCWRNNIPSVKTAKKAGFRKLTDYDIVFLSFK